jgi:spore maturation protein CgeB
MTYQYEGVFVDGVNCVMFENDLSDLNEKINYYLSNEEERNKIIETAYHTAVNNYTWKHTAEKLLKEIEEL